MNKKIVETLKNYYHARDHNNDYKRGNLGFGFIHYALIRNLRPKNILVVGSQRGYVPAICGLACKHEGLGRVTFVDAGFDMNAEGEEAKRSWGGLGIWKTATKDYWKPLGLENFIEILCMTTEQFVSHYTSREFEYIYIDGDHSYEGVKKDFNLLWDHLKEGGYMVFHDVLVEKETDWGKCGVKKFWEELKKTRGFLTIPFEAGLGIIQK